jgi:hypothetical protein
VTDSKPPLHHDSDPERNWLDASDEDAIPYWSGDEQYNIAPMPQLVDPAKATKFTPEIKAVYLRALANDGQVNKARMIAGVSAGTLASHRASDPDFAKAEEEAHAHFDARVESEISHQALVGDWEPVRGRVDKDQDGIIGYQRKKNWDALRLLAQTRMPKYRNGGHPALGGEAPGLLVVYAPMAQNEWIEATKGKLLPEDPLHGIPGAEGLLLENNSDHRRGTPEED